MLTARGKFLFAGDDKVYLKAIRRGSLSKPFNTLWRGAGGPPARGFDTAALGMSRSSGAARDGQKGGRPLPRCDSVPQFLDGLRPDPSPGLVLHLGLADALRGWFAGEPATLDAWLAQTRETLAAFRDIGAVDVGGPVPEAVRKWLGPARLARVLRQACQAVRRLSPTACLTATCDEQTLSMVLPYVDFVSCVHDDASLSDYRIGLARLQHRVGGLPLVVHLSNPDEHRVRMAFLAGCAGVVVEEPTLPSLLEQMPFETREPLPRMSVVVCVFNGEETLAECLDGLARVDYPDYEVIVVDDGSRDGTLALARDAANRYGFKIVALPVNGGLSAARNAGAAAANGEIIAYLDSDAFPDVHWLRYLALTFLSTKHAMVGGPNLNPLSEGPVSDCIDKSPGNPDLVMADAELADHLPGCNMAVRRAYLEAIGGFDPGFRGAGDDVVFCWRVLAAGGTLGVSPGAMVWHHRRPTVRAFLRQQRSYGCGEAWLSRAWPQRFNALGHQVQAGSAPGRPRTARPMGYYQGMGDGPLVVSLARMPEWPLLVLALGMLSLLGVACPPLWLNLLPFSIALGAWLYQALAAASSARLRYPGASWRALTAFLHLAQPVARLRGRLSQGLCPWSRRGPAGFSMPTSRIRRVPVPDGASQTQLSDAFNAALQARKLPFVRGGQGRNWDWQVDGGLLGGVRCLLDCEKGSDPFLSVRLWPHAGGLLPWAMAPVVLAWAMACWAGTTWLAVLLYAAAMGLPVLAFAQMGSAMAAVWPITADPSWLPMAWDRFQPDYLGTSLSPSPSAVSGGRRSVLSCEESLQRSLA